MNIHEVVMKLLIEQPFYGAVASSMAFYETDKIETIKMSAIPRLVINYNPEWFLRLSDYHKMGVVLHEILHMIFMHPYRCANREIILWSVACDMAVNELIPPNYRTEDAVTVEKIAKKIKRNIERNKSADYYYDLITDVEDRPGFAFVSGDNILIFEDEKQLKVQKLFMEAASEIDIKAMKYNFSQMINEAESDGELPSGLGEGIDEVYRDIRMDWRVILKRFLTGRGRMIVRKTYKRQSRRYEELPGTKRSVGVNALIAIDESGSIKDAMVKEFYRELKEINKITGVSMMVTRFDTQCSEPVPLNQFIVDSAREKRGGTDFRPIFKLADEIKIPLVIIFTDGDGEAPSEANQNTLWVLTENARKPADFGYCLTFGGGN